MRCSLEYEVWFGSISSRFSTASHLGRTVLIILWGSTPVIINLSKCCSPMHLNSSLVTNVKSAFFLLNSNFLPIFLNLTKFILPRVQLCEVDETFMNFRQGLSDEDDRVREVWWAVRWALSLTKEHYYTISLKSLIWKLTEKAHKLTYEKMLVGGDILFFNIIVLNCLKVTNGHHHCHVIGKSRVKQCHDVIVFLYGFCKIRMILDQTR